MECQGKNKAKAKFSGWDKAIADAQRKIRSLHESIAVFKARKKAGEQWPDVAATPN
jgi:hypothetical protein